MTERGFTAAEYGILRGSQLFSGFSQEDFSYALDFFGARAARYEKGEFLHRVGSRLSRFGLVLSGRVQVHMDDFEGNLLIMANVTPGKTFGESLCFLEREEEQQLVREALESLSPQDREIFFRHYYYAQTVGEISLAMGMNGSTVKTRLRRGRERLKGSLLKEGFADEA